MPERTKTPNQIFLLRWRRIVWYLLAYLFTGKKPFLWECQHNYYTKTFNDGQRKRS